jgi:lysophospholipase L1-like esterase
VRGAAINADTGKKVTYPPLVGTFNYSTRRILCLGDSITHGVGWIPSCGYRDLLSNTLGSTGGFTGLQFVGTLNTSNGSSDGVTCPANNQQMFHAGFDGATCNDLIIDLPTVMAAAVPDVVLMHAGTNDLIAVVGGTETLADAMLHFTQLLTDVCNAAPNAVIFAATLVPSPNLATPTPTFNANVVSQVAAQSAAGFKVFECDQFSALNPATDFDAGGVHPNSLGYPKMAAAWYHSMTTLTP